MTRPTRRGRHRRGAHAEVDRPYRPRRHMVSPVTSSCGCAKQAYLSETLAANAATLIALAGGRSSHPYRCPAGGPDWHLTSQPLR